MRRQTQYWITCPKCGHQMGVRVKGGPLRAKYCDKCNLLFCLTNEELKVAESISAGGMLPVADPFPEARKPRRR